MEPFDYPDSDPGPHTLTTRAKPQENLDKLHWALGRFTGYTGVVNFMGAKLTSDEAALAPILREIGGRGLVFLDDGSSSRSLVGAVAPSAARPGGARRPRARRHDAGRGRRPRARPARGDGEKARLRDRHGERLAGDGRAHRCAGRARSRRKASSSCRYRAPTAPRGDDGAAQAGAARFTSCPTAPASASCF